MKDKPPVTQKEKAPRKLGRPCKPISWQLFEDLCAIHCTHDEIAGILHIAKSTLYERASREYEEDFPTLYKRLTSDGKASLRRIQFRQAKNNATMAIWLGKQYLGQRDPEKRETDTSQAHAFVAGLTQLINGQVQPDPELKKKLAKLEEFEIEKARKAESAVEPEKAPDRG